MDLITNQKIPIETGINYTPDIVITSNTKSVFFLQPLSKQDDNVRGIRNLENNKIYNLTGQTINTLDLSLDNKYILFEKYSIGDTPHSTKKSFSVFDTQKETFFKNSVQGSFAIWGL